MAHQQKSKARDAMSGPSGIFDQAGTSGVIPRGRAKQVATVDSVQVMLYVAAALQVVAAGVALMLIPISGMRKSWLLICAALVIQA